MNSEHLSRRQFIEQAVLAAGVLALGSVASAQSAGAAPAATPATAPATSPALAAAVKRTASDIVDLGKTGLKCTRLGLGLGSNNGRVQVAAGVEAFNGFIKHAFDQGITFYDTCESYSTFRLLGAAVKGLPRDKIFIQSKIEQPRNILATIDNHRKTLNTDYVDSMLVHVQIRPNWTDTWKAAMDDFNAAVDKKWIKAKGVSCHSLPALRAGVESDWTQVHLVRVNPQGVRMDSEQQVSYTTAINDPKPVVEELKKMKEKGRAVIGMKIFGDGTFHAEADREKSLRFAMGLKEIDAVIIGFANTDQMDQGIKLMNKVLAEPAAAT